MVERVTTREKGPEARQDWYEEQYRFKAERRERALKGTMLIRGKEVPWVQSRQALLKYYVHPRMSHTASWNWISFIQEIRTHSGRHRHQGGLVIYVLEGKGYTVVDGARHDWKEGDLLLLPVKPNGCEHQHFNEDPERPAKWLAIVYQPFFDMLGNQLEQTETHPDYR